MLTAVGAVVAVLGAPVEAAEKEVEDKADEEADNAGDAALAVDFEASNTPEADVDAGWREVEVGVGANLPLKGVAKGKAGADSEALLLTGPDATGKPPPEAG